MEDNPEPKYFLDQRQIDKVLERSKNSKSTHSQTSGIKTIPIIYDKSQAYRVYSAEGSSVTLAANGGGIGAKTGLYAVVNGASVQDRIYSDDGVSPTLTATDHKKPKKILTQTDSSDKGVLMVNGEPHNVRRLSPRECFRLQGFPDDMFDRIPESVSDTQRYKQAGNAVTATVAYEIGRYILQTND